MEIVDFVLFHERGASHLRFRRHFDPLGLSVIEKSHAARGDYSSVLSNMVNEKLSLMEKSLKNMVKFDGNY